MQTISCTSRTGSKHEPRQGSMCAFPIPNAAQRPGPAIAGSYKLPCAAQVLKAVPGVFQHCALSRPSSCQTPVYHMCHRRSRARPAQNPSTRRTPSQPHTAASDRRSCERQTSTTARQAIRSACSSGMTRSSTTRICRRGSRRLYRAPDTPAGSTRISAAASSPVQSDPTLSSYPGPTNTHSGGSTSPRTSGTLTR